MTFNFDILLAIIAFFTFLSGLYYGFFAQFRRTLGSVGGMVVALFVTDVIYEAMQSASGVIDIFEKIINFLKETERSLCAKLIIGATLFIVTKIIIQLVIGIFKPRGLKSLIKEKKAGSSFVGGILGLIDAYAIGAILFVGFSILAKTGDVKVANTIYSIFPTIANLLANL